MQLEAGGGVAVGTWVGVMRGVGVGVGVVIWLGIDSIGISVGVGDGEDCTLLWLNESPVMELDDEERVDATVPHAASKTINERNNRPLQIFFKTIPLPSSFLHAQWL